MFSPLMMQTWEAATAVAVVAGVAGWFAVLRGSAFAAHALPNGAFAGAAGATLAGTSVLVGVGIASAVGALLIAGFARRARRDVATALTVVALLGLGSLFLSLGDSYGSSAYSLLFGQVLAVSPGEVQVTGIVALAALVALAIIWRPLTFSSIAPEIAAARGVSPAAADLAFLGVLAAVTTMALPVVGALLVFSLLVAPAAAAVQVVRRPLSAVALSVGLSLGLVWAAVAIAFRTDLPVGFLVGAGGALLYVAARVGRRLAAKGVTLRP